MQYKITENGFEPAFIYRQSDTYDPDNIFGLSKKEKERKAAKKEAKKAAIAKGLSGRAVRLAGKAAKLEKKVEQKGDKAKQSLINRAINVEAKAAGLEVTKMAVKDGVPKRTAKAMGKAVEAEIKTGKKETGIRKLLNVATLGIVKKDPSEKAIIKQAKAVEKVEQLKKSGGAPIKGGAKRAVRDAGQEAKADILEKKGKTKQAERLRARDGETGLKRFGEDVITAPLLPFKGKMKSILESKGIPAPKRLADLAQVFYDNVVKNSDTYMPIQGFALNFKKMTPDHAAAILPVVVEAIVNFFRNSKDKRDKGQPVSELEEKAADAQDIIDRKVDEKVREEAAQTIGEKLLYDTKTQLIALGVVALVVMIAVKIAKK